MLGEMYEFGEGVSHDHQKALEWIRKGTVDWPQSAMIVANRYEHGFKAPTNLPKAMERYRISAEAGYVVAQTSLGELYETVPGLLNLDEAVWWYRAAANTWGPAMCDLGHLYDTGKGVAQDYSEAARWYRTAIEKAGAGCGEYGLGLLYEQGLGVPQDRKKAMELYHGAAAVNADAQRRLFSLYEGELDLPADPDKAIEWYRANAQRGDRRAELGLGLHYQYGKGVPTNLYVAYALYILAQQQLVGQDDLPDFTGPQDKGYWYTGAPVQALAEAMSNSGNLLTAIQNFIDNPPSEPIEE
jgi:TPR repeat protein